MKCGGKFEKGGEKLKSIPVPRMPMRQLGIDCITNLPNTEEGYDTIVTAIDYTSKWPESKPLKGKFTEGVTEFIYELVCHCGAAKIHISDQGRKFVHQVCVISCSYIVYIYIFITVYDRDYFCVRLRICVHFIFIFYFLLLYSKVADKFYELTNIRHNITSAYHPQANGEVGRFNRTTQEAFLKCQEIYDEVINADTQWHKKLQSILFTYRTRKHASTKISPYMIMYGRECVMPWELDGDLGPLENEEDRDLPMEEVMERMYNIREQVLDVAAANIKRAQMIQTRSCNAKHCRNAFEVSEKVWRRNPLRNTKQKSLKKGPKWYGPYKVAERKDGGNGNYLLLALSGRNKGQASKKSYPPNHLKRFIHRNPEIPEDSDSEYGSDNEDSVPASQESGIGSQESVPENPSPVPSDATTVLYPNPDEGDTLLGLALIDDPGLYTAKDDGTYSHSYTKLI